MMGGYMRYKKIDIELMEKDYSSGLTNELIAKKHNVSVKTVTTYMRRNGLIKSKGKQLNGLNNPMYGFRSVDYNRSSLKKFIRMWGSMKSIAEHLGVCQNSVFKAMKEKGVWYKGGRGSAKIPKDLLVKLYGKGFTIRKIGTILGIDDGSVARAFTQYGISYDRSRGWKNVSDKTIKSGGLSSLRREAEFKWEEGQQFRIRERENFKCFICSIKEDGVALHVHHVMYDLAYSEDKYLVALCHSCHVKTNAWSKKKADILKMLWRFYFTHRLSETYGYVYDMNEGGGGLTHKCLTK